MRRSLAIVGLVVVALATGCGDSTTTLASSDRADLHNRVSQVRAAAAAHDPDSARLGLIALRDRVGELERAGTLSSEQGNEILAAATEVESTLHLVPTTTTTLPDDEHGNGKGKGKGGKGED